MMVRRIVLAMGEREGEREKGEREAEEIK